MMQSINTIQVNLPALNERKEDIPLLVDYFKGKYEKKYSKLKLEISN